MGINSEAYQKLIGENHELSRRMKEAQKSLDEKNQEVLSYQSRAQGDSLDNMTLKKACSVQKNHIADLERNLRDFQDELYHNRIEMDEKLSEKISFYENGKRELI